MTEDKNTFHLTGTGAGTGIVYGTVDSLKEGDERQYAQGTSYEDAVAATGYGYFNYKLLAICGWALSSDAIEVFSISFILPPATEELKLTSSAKGWLNAIVFVGMVIGCYLWGSLADIYGRQRVLLTSLTVNGLGGLISSFAQNFWLFFFLRFVSGIGVGGSLPVMFSYYMEFQPMSKRGCMTSLLNAFWMSGGMISAGLAWLIIPHTNIGIFRPSFTYNSWRIFLAACTVPALSSVLFLLLMPESPRYLLHSGHGDRALMVLKQMYKSNNPGKDTNDYPVDCLQIPNIVESHDNLPSRHGFCDRVMAGLSDLMKLTAKLFRAPFTRLSVIMVIIYFTLSFGTYGLFMWFPELFNRMESSGGSPCSLGEANHTVNVTSGFSSYIYVQSFITNAANLPGNIFAVLFIERINNGRNVLLAASMVMSGVCVFFITLLKTQVETLIMFCIFSGISVIGWNALLVITMEVYPTNLRSTASGFVMGTGRIAAIMANLIFGALVSVHCIVPMLMVAVFMTLGGLSALLLPNMAGEDIDQPAYIRIAT